MLTRMEFKFSEEKCKKYGVTLYACYKTIEKLMAKDGIHQYGLGVYVAPLKKAFHLLVFLPVIYPSLTGLLIQSSLGTGSIVMNIEIMILQIMIVFLLKG